MNAQDLIQESTGLLKVLLDSTGSPNSLDCEDTRLGLSLIIGDAIERLSRALMLMNDVNPELTPPTPSKLPTTA